MNSPRSILITGATGVVGAQLVQHFLGCGDTVIAAAYDDVPGVGPLASLGEGLDVERLYRISLDLESDTAVTDLLAFLDENHLRPTGLVNGARNITHLKLNESNRPDIDGWLGEFRLGVVVAHELTLALAERSDSLLESVVSISSMYGLVAPTPRLYEDFEKQSPIHYGVVKAAQIHLGKELAVRLAGRNIRVNTVSLGGVEGRVDEAFKKRYTELCPQGRMLKGQDVVGAVEFLLSDGASSVTGHNLVVDGGWTAW